MLSVTSSNSTEGNFQQLDVSLGGGHFVFTSSGLLQLASPRNKPLPFRLVDLLEFADNTAQLAYVTTIRILHQVLQIGVATSKPSDDPSASTTMLPSLPD